MDEVDSYLRLGNLFFFFLNILKGFLYKMCKIQARKQLGKIVLN